jgi:hypothetical protein
MNDQTQNSAPEITFEQRWVLFQENAHQMKEQRQDFDRRLKEQREEAD